MWIFHTCRQYMTYTQIKASHGWSRLKCYVASEWKQTYQKHNIPKLMICTQSCTKGEVHIAKSLQVVERGTLDTTVQDTNEHLRQRH